MSKFHRDNSDRIVEATQEVLPLLKRKGETHGALELMRFVYTETDRQYKAASDRTSCGLGCSFCCHDEIMMSDIEAKVIEAKIDSGEIKIANPRIKKTLEVQNSNIFRTLNFMEKRCSMLNEKNECTIYEHRPLICRTHNSTDSPQLCKPDKNGKLQEHGQIFALIGEAFQLALFALSGNRRRSLHRVLWKKLNENE